MATTTTQKLCLLIITLCIIAPIGIGFMIPQSTDTVREYETGQTANINSDIRNATADYWGTYTGQYNNSLWGGSYPGLASSNLWYHTSTPNSTPETTSESRTGSALWSYDYIDTSMSYFTSYGYIMHYNGTNANQLKIVKTMPSGSTTTRVGYTEVAYFPSLQKLLADNVELDLSSGSYKITSEDLNNTKYTEWKASSSNYRDISKGIHVGSALQWQNGYVNDRISMVAQMQPDSSWKLQDITFARTDGGTVYVEYTSTDEQTYRMTLGMYEQIWIQIDSDGLTVAGLVKGAISEDPSGRAVTSRHFDYDIGWTTPFTSFMIRGINYFGDSYSIDLYVYSTEIKVGTYSATVNKTIDMEGYYPGMDGYAIRFNNGSTIGADATLTVAGYTFDVYDAGFITYDGIRYNLTGTIITVVNDDYTSYMYINGQPVEADLSEWSSVVLGGNWGSIGVSISEMTGNNKEIFVWESGLFKLSIAEYAGIGLAVAAGSFILCALIGRRSGQKVFWLLIASGCCAAAYAALLLGA